MSNEFSRVQLNAKHKIQNLPIFDGPIHLPLLYVPKEILKILQQM